MKVGIIAAGEGSRLREDGVTTPKPLVRLNGTPLLERLFWQYSSLGISEAHCIINEESTAVKRYMENRYLPLPVYFHVKTTESSMHSLFELAPYLTGDHFLLSTVDSIFDTSELRTFLRHAQGKNADALIGVSPHVRDENPLWVELDATDRIIAFRKPALRPSFVTGGLYFFSPRIFNERREAERQGISRLRNFLGLLLRMGYTLYGYRFTKIIDLDHAEDIPLAEGFLQSVEGNRTSG